MRRSPFFWLLLAVAACTTSDAVNRPSPLAPPVATFAVFDQGWSGLDRENFYTTGQGSRLLPFAWYKALRRLDSPERFGADQLARYHYLPSASGSGLPIGFVVDAGSDQLGMTCAACHTGSLSYKGTTWRIDGGRARADFQRFLADLAAAARATVGAPDRMRAFVADVDGPAATPTQAAALTNELAAWTDGFGHFMQNSLPPSAWGPGRLDAFGMIFNRVTALDLGIEANYRPADAPVRYPFLWNAAFQDRTQWDGAAPNGSYVKALARNAGEAFGVFGQFAPVHGFGVVDYDNSLLFRQLQSLEVAIGTLRPPAWPRAVFGLNQGIVARGAGLFDANCASCHAARPSSAVSGLWSTPVCRVGTDSKMYDNALLSAASGILGGTPQLSGGGVLQDPDKKLAILANAVVGSLLRNAFDVDTGIWRAIDRDLLDPLRNDLPGPPIALPAKTLPPECGTAATATPVAAAVFDVPGARSVVAAQTTKLYQMPASGTAPAPNDSAYESRVLSGIWAVAPYLHNGSVPSLWELLKPPAERAKVFSVGTTEFDPVNVGLAAGRAGALDLVVGDPGSGNSNLGHAYGTALPEADRWALLEYLKTI